MNRWPSISVVIPTYNRANSVCEAIRSALSQDYPGLEVVVVDDGSTDETAEQLDGFDSRVRYVKQLNRGPASARNRGIELARGDWIAFLDSDDLFLPDKLRQQIECTHRRPDAVLVSCWYHYTGAGAALARPRNLELEGDVSCKLPWLVPFGPFATPTMLVRRDALLSCGGFDGRLWLSEDTDLWCRLAWRGPFALLRKSMVEVRRLGDNLSAGVEFRAAFEIWRGMADKWVAEGAPMSLLLRRRLIAWYAAWAWSLSSPLDWSLAIESFRYWPPALVSAIPTLSARAAQHCLPQTVLAAARRTRKWMRITSAYHSDP